MSRSPFDPIDEAPPSLRRRIVGQLRRKLEPTAQRLQDWCRTLEARIQGLGSKLGRAEETTLGLAEEVDRLEGTVVGFARTAEAVERRLSAAEAEATASALASKATGEALAAILDRLGAIDARLGAIEDRIGSVEAAHGAVAARVGAAEEHVRTLDDRDRWSHEALLERIQIGEGVMEARLDGIGRHSELSDREHQAHAERLAQADARFAAVSDRFDRVDSRIDEQLPVPMAFALDAMAMGTRLAALEDQVEGLQVELAKARGDEADATLVAFPAEPRAEAEAEAETERSDQAAG